MDKNTPYASVATIGIDLAKKVFQVHAVDACGQVVLRRTVKRRELLAFAEQLPACVIGISVDSALNYPGLSSSERGLEPR